MWLDYKQLAYITQNKEVIAGQLKFLLFSMDILNTELKD